MPPDIQIENDHPSLMLDAVVLENQIRHCLTAEGFSAGYLGIILTDHDTVLALNRDFLDHDYLTDVLSFPLQSSDVIAHNGIVEGEIYVDLDTAQERAAEFEATFTQEATRYVLHGLLHLLGYDDATPQEKQQMHTLEDRYLGNNT